MEPSPGILMETLVPPDGADAQEWIDWYDEHRLRLRAEVDGVVAARRGTSLIGSVPHVVVYDLTDVLVPLTQAWRDADADGGAPPDDLVPIHGAVDVTPYRQIFSLHPGDYVPEPTPVLHTAIFEVPSRDQDEFNDWYNSEHVSFIREHVPGYLNCRRFQGLEDTNKFTALYDVESIDNSHAKDVHPLNHTPWATRVRAKLPTYTERRIFEIQAAYGPHVAG